MRDDQVRLDPDVDPSALTVGDFDIKNAVFIVPSDAPLPNELQDAVTSGHLLQRLVPLGIEKHEAPAVVPLSGTELLALAPAWRALTKALRVYAIFDLPGARYDVPFTQAMRQIGIRRVDWQEIVDAVARRNALLQSTKDSEPWRIQGAGPAGNKPFPAQRDRNAMIEPPADEAEDADI